MVLRTYNAFDSSSLVVDASSPFLTPGSPIINNSDTPDGTIFTFLGGVTPVDVTIDDVGGDPDVIEDDDPANHTVVDGGGIVANGTPVEGESHQFVQELDASGTPFGPLIQITVFSQNGNFGDIWGFAISEPLTPGARYQKISGSNIGSEEYVNFAPCCCAGVRIRTPDGSIAVEDITAGTRLWTHEGPPLVVQWTGVNTIDGTGENAPVRFEKGAFGATDAFAVSPLHKILVSGLEVELLFGLSSGLASAKTLVGRPGVSSLPCQTVTYHHFMFDRHAIVSAYGVLMESFYPGATAIKALAPLARAELQHRFPHFFHPGQCTWPTAAPVLVRHEVEALQQFCRRQGDETAFRSDGKPCEPRNTAPLYQA